MSLRHPVFFHRAASIWRRNLLCRPQLPMCKYTVPRSSLHCSVLQRVAACCSVLQCVAACCSVLQCVLLCVAHRRPHKSASSSAYKWNSDTSRMNQSDASVKQSYEWRYRKSDIPCGLFDMGCVLYTAATQHNTLQHTATHCNTLHIPCGLIDMGCGMCTAATQHNTLQHTLQHTAHSMWIN